MTAKARLTGLGLVALLCGMGSGGSSPVTISSRDIILNPAKPKLGLMLENTTPKVPFEMPKNIEYTERWTPQTAPVPHVTYGHGDPIKITVIAEKPNVYFYRFVLAPNGQIAVRMSGKPCVCKKTEEMTFKSLKYEGDYKFLALMTKRELQLTKYFEMHEGMVALMKGRGQEYLTKVLSEVVKPLPANSWATLTFPFTAKK